MGTIAYTNRDAWRKSFHEQLSKLTRLPEGSDSWSPHRPGGDVLATAAQIGEDVGREGIYVALVAATSEGGVQLKWYESRRELSFIVYADRSVEYLFLNLDRNERQAGDLPDLQQAGRFAGRLLK